MGVAPLAGFIAISLPALTPSALAILSSAAIDGVLVPGSFCAI
jgi:hypothetical protein